MSRLPLAALLFFGLALPVLAAEKEHLRIKIDGPLPSAPRPGRANLQPGQARHGDRLRSRQGPGGQGLSPLAALQHRALSVRHPRQPLRQQIRQRKGRQGRLRQAGGRPGDAARRHRGQGYLHRHQAGRGLSGGGLKLAPGRSPATGDWRFVQLLPDGSYIGDTTGDSPEDVAFCFTCHKTMAKADFLFFLPKAYRK